jgi:hypothetical protein
MVVTMKQITDKFLALQDHIDALQGLCAPFFVYTRKPNAGPEYITAIPDNMGDLLSYSRKLKDNWRSLTLEMPPSNRHCPYMLTQSGHYLTWQQCYDLTEAFDKLTDPITQNMGIMQELAVAQRVLDCVKPLADIYEPLMETSELYGAPMFTPCTQNFPSLAGRDDLSLNADALYEIAHGYDKGTKQADNIRLDVSKTLTRPAYRPHAPQIH